MKKSKRSIKDVGVKETVKKGEEVGLETIIGNESPICDDVSETEVVSENDELESGSHKKQLAELAKKDPQFYKFLKEQDADLLEFDDFDDEEDERMDSGSSQASKSDKYQTDTDGRQVIDITFVENLKESLCEENAHPIDIRRAIGAFTTCVARVGAKIKSSDFVIYDEKLFEDILKLCFFYLGPRIYTLLGPETVKKNKSKNSKIDANNQTFFKRWKKYSGVIKVYLHALILFLNEVQTTNVVACTLRAITELLELYIHFPKLTRNMSKVLVRIWSRKTLECRCLAFIAICKLVRVHQNSYNTLLKWCYFGYVSNARAVSADSWPLIIFLQKSFAELCMIHPEIAYQYIFVYIRQTAIHLRNAMIAKRKDLIQTVYNWQFMQCLYIWSHVISRAHQQKITDDVQYAGIKELVYPLCQIVITVLKLFPSLKYFPLRLHCLRILLTLQSNCKIYIPTLALAIELLNDAKLMLKNKPTKGKGAIKEVDMKCMLKATTQHLVEASYRSKALEELFKISLEATRLVHSSCAFPDVIVPLEPEIKIFVKGCKNVEYAQVFKSFGTVIKKHSQYASQLLNSSEIDLRNPASLVKFSVQIQAPNSPFMAFYNSWQNIWKLKKEAMKPIDDRQTRPHASESIACKTIQENDIYDPITSNIEQTDRSCTMKVRRKKSHKKVEPEKRADEDIIEDLILSDVE